MSYSDEDVRSFHMKMSKYQDAMPSIKKKLLGSIAAVIVVNYFFGAAGIAALVYLLIGYKICDFQGYSFKSDWEFYAVMALWPLLVAVGLVWQGVN